MSCGDIFKGAPAVDAIVSPANSFGFMDGGIDMVRTLICRNLVRSSQNVGKCPGGRVVLSKFFWGSPSRSLLYIIYLQNGNPFHLPIVTPPLTATSPQSGQWLSSVSKVAIVERFDCSLEQRMIPFNCCKQCTCF